MSKQYVNEKAGRNLLPIHTLARKVDVSNHIIKDPRKANFGNYQPGAVFLCPAGGVKA